MKHGLGIAIFSVLASVSLAIVGCGGSGSGMGVLEPYPTGGPGGQGGSGGGTPRPPRPPEAGSAYEVLESNKLYNPIAQVYAPELDKVFFVQGFSLTNTQIPESELEYRLMSYDPRDGSDGNLAKAQEVKFIFRDQNNQEERDWKGLQSPYGIAYTYDNMGTEDASDDRFYLGITDVGTTKRVYLLEFRKDKEGQWEGKAKDILTSGGMSSSYPLNCAFDQNLLFWTDYTGGKVCAFSFRDFVWENDTNDVIWNKDVIARLQFPAAIKTDGPVGAVTCQGDNKIVLFKINQPAADLEKQNENNWTDGEHGYPLQTDGPWRNYILPEDKYESTYNRAFDLAWTQVTGEGETGANYYLVATSGNTLPASSLSDSSKDNGTLWIYDASAYIKYDNAGELDLEDLRQVTDSAEYKLLLEDLAFPVNPCFPRQAAQTWENPYIDIAFLTTGSATSPDNHETLGAINLVRYNWQTKSVEEGFTQTVIDKLEDPFALIVNPVFNQLDSLAFLYVTHWNWSYKTNTGGKLENGHVFGVRGYVPQE